MLVGTLQPDCDSLEDRYQPLQPIAMKAKFGPPAKMALWLPEMILLVII